MLIPVLLSGGVGSRLWPVSRELYPKQFLPLADEKLSLFQQTLERLGGMPALGEPVVVCNEEHRFLVAQQLRDMGHGGASIILEPIGRNTAPAIALAAIDALRQTEDAVLLVLPADHVIRDCAALQRAAQTGMTLAGAGHLVTFGIVPHAPETGYGYIRRGAALDDQVYAVSHFAEKPDLETANAYVASGEYFWNSGMFLFRADRYLEELDKHAPQMLAACRKAYEQASDDLDFIRVHKESFTACPSDSIDYAVMERTDRAAMVPLDCGWNDVGSWGALWQTGTPDARGNVSRGDVILRNVSNAYVRAESRLVAAVGLEDVVIVETADAVLVANKDSSQDVKHVVAHLKLEGRGEAITHKRVYRPWGSYESLVESDRFQVKRIIVNPGQQLSLQMHHHRAEHWVVVKGTARVTHGEQETMLGEDQSTYIPLGTKHRLANPGVIPLEIIEVQTGSYLGEDDIVRFNDVYGRAPS
ncbi:MAG: mannose-1-phosphate guanylyltransferase/mannose-6-phosphate isomerase [Gammaproteobacteria bacterium]|nr:mannose-1-phosphate guanylyltransferase/mannose-6-phosphate isomerase [Gammaproteobacteria bacterium]